MHRSIILSLVSAALVLVGGGQAAQAASATSPGPTGPAGPAVPSVPHAAVAAAGLTQPTYPANAPAVGPFSVSGNLIKNGNGQPFFVHGVDRPSLEWSCRGQSITGKAGIPASDFSTIRSSWHANAVRVPLNQDYWLSSTGAKVAVGSYCPNYISTVKAVVAEIQANHMVAILDLHWSDRGSTMNQPGQQPMADANSVRFWHSVASTFGSDNGVMFELYNEPHSVSWSVWRNGGPVTVNGNTYQAAGMQQLYDAVRSTGASNVVIAGGLKWAYDLTGVTNGYALSGSNIAYASHPYSFKSGTSPAAWEQYFGQVAQTHPVIATEFGTYATTVTPYDSAILRFFDSHGIGYTGWAWWNGGPKFPSLIDNASGQCYLGGCAVQADIAALASGTKRVTVPTLGAGAAPAPTPAIGSISPASAAAGETVTLNGSGFAGKQGAGYLHFSDNGVNWGAPGDMASFHVASWSATRIVFTVPTGSGASGTEWQVAPGSTAGITITTPAGTSALTSMQVAKAPPSAMTTPPVTTRGSVGLTGWRVAWGAPAISTTPISSGAVIGLHGAGYGAVSSEAEPLARLAPGDTVTMTIGNFTGHPLRVVPFGWSAHWAVHFATAETAAPGWGTITFTVPPMASGLGQIGLQVDNGAGYQAQMEIGKVSYALRGPG